MTKILSAPRNHTCVSSTEAEATGTLPAGSAELLSTRPILTAANQHQQHEQPKTSVCKLSDKRCLPTGQHARKAVHKGVTEMVS